MKLSWLFGDTFLEQPVGSRSRFLHLIFVEFIEHEKIIFYIEIDLINYITD